MNTPRRIVENENGIGQEPILYRQPSYWPVMQPVGCVCPPGANKDCERPDCPRKPLKDVKTT